MIEKEARGFFSFLVAAATGRNMPALPSEASLPAWQALAAFHSVETIFAYGLLESAFPLSAETKERLYQKLAAAALDTAQKEALLKETEAALLGKGIDYMPLKGALLLPLYRYPEMRQMVDVDLLVREEQREDIEAAMKESGFRFVLESNHEYVFAKNGCTVELHKYLIPTYHEAYYAYYGTGWRLAEETDTPGRYAMSPADTLIYLFVHFAKHYRDAGAGLRPLLDFILWQEKTKPEETYIKAELEKLGLLTFGEKIQALLSAWLFEGDLDETTSEMERFILMSGSLGTAEGRTMAEEIRRKKKSRLLRKLFPSSAALRGKYPRLRRRKYLLPFYWVRRWGRILFRIKGIRKREKWREAVRTEENVRRYTAHMEKVGLLREEKKA